MRVICRSSARRGFVLMTMAATMFVLLAVIGLAFDLGRVYIARNEAQIFVDAASMAAATKLNGTAAGLEQARSAVSKLPNRWNLSTQDFRGVEIAFSADGVHWENQPKAAAGIAFARVNASQNSLEITFLRAVGGPANFTIPAYASATTNPVRLVE